MKELILIAIGAALVNNVAASRLTRRHAACG